MIEIVFSDSAHGSLALAQTYGKGSYNDGAASVCYLGDETPTPEELERAQREAEARCRAEWEQAVPMGGKVSDIYGFHLALSVGEISEDGIGPQREAALRTLFSIEPPEHRADVATTLLETSKAALKEVLYRLSSSEAVRVWYSDQPDELCGLHWFLAQLPEKHGPVFLVKLPALVRHGEKTLCRPNGWGEIAPGEWGRFVCLQEEAPSILIRSYAAHWKLLQEENAPLRAVLNGRLLSVRADLYDSFILQEIGAQPEEFREAVVVGNVLGKYQLGISDGWIALRIEEMIRNGLLEAVTQPEKDAPIYHRKLRKRGVKA